MLGIFAGQLLLWPVCDDPRSLNSCLPQQQGCSEAAGFDNECSESRAASWTGSRAVSASSFPQQQQRVQQCSLAVSTDVEAQAHAPWPAYHRALRAGAGSKHAFSVQDFSTLLASCQPGSLLETRRRDASQHMLSAAARSTCCSTTSSRM